MKCFFKFALVIMAMLIALTPMYSFAEDIPAADSKVTGIAISQPPSVCVYTEGSDVSTAGMRLLVTYADKSTQTVSSGYTVGRYSKKPGRRTINIYYENQKAPYFVTFKTMSASRLASRVTSSRWNHYSAAEHGWSWAAPYSWVTKYGARYRMSDKKIYFTFDIGYVNKSTWKILDILKKRKVKAIFFTTYPVARDNPKIIKRILADGHLLGNHSTTHGDFAKMSLKSTKKEVLTMHNYVLKKYHYRMEYFRYPAGCFNKRSLYFMKAIRYKPVFWNFAHYDYNAAAQPAAGPAYRNVVKHLHSGSIMLLHGQSSTNAKILDKVITKARSRGYELGQFKTTVFY